jgi:hypothetical protein
LRAKWASEEPQTETISQGWSIALGATFNFLHNFNSAGRAACATVVSRA